MLEFCLCLLFKDDDKSAKKKAVAAGLGGDQEEKTLEELQAEEEVTDVILWLHGVSPYARKSGLTQTGLNSDRGRIKS